MKETYCCGHAYDFNINTFVMHATIKHVFILNNKSWPWYKLVSYQAIIATLQTSTK